MSAGRRPPLVEVLLAPITQPYAQDLRDFLLFSFREGVVELKRPRTFRTARGVPMRVPVAARQPYTATDFFAQSLAAQAFRSVCVKPSRIHSRAAAFAIPSSLSSDILHVHPRPEAGIEERGSSEYTSQNRGIVRFGALAGPVLLPRLCELRRTDHYP